MKDRVKILANSPQILSSERAPLYRDRPQAGFPSPAEDSVEESLDLNNYVIKNPASTFFVRVEGDSMEGTGIFSGDILVVDRSREPANNSIVVASIFDELTVKRFVKRKGRVYLVPENNDYGETEITEEMDSSVWGVVTHSIKSFVS